MRIINLCLIFKFSNTKTYSIYWILKHKLLLNHLQCKILLFYRQEEQFLEVLIILCQDLDKVLLLFLILPHLKRELERKQILQQQIKIETIFIKNFLRIQETGEKFLDRLTLLKTSVQSLKKSDSLSFYISIIP